MMSVKDVRERSGPVLLTILLVLTAVATAGCLVDEDEGDDAVVPEDRRDVRLVVDGDVSTPINLTIQEVVDLGLEDFEATFENSAGTFITSNHTGVRLGLIMDLAGVSGTADIMEVEASDGYQALVILTYVSRTTHLAVKEDGEWHDLADLGALRLVDTNMASVYWVKDIVAIHFRSSTPLEVLGLAKYTDILTAGWIAGHTNTEVSWQEGDKTRTYLGVRMVNVLQAIGADEANGTALGLSVGNERTVISTWHSLNKGVLVVDSNGSYVYIEEEEDDLVLVGLTTLEVSPGLQLGGVVGQDVAFTLEALRELPVREVASGGSTYRGAALEAIVALSWPDATADAVSVIASDGNLATFPLANLSTATLAYEVDGGPLPEGEGPFKIADSARGEPFWVSVVTEVYVWASQPIDVNGFVNITEALTIGTIDSVADALLTFNDGMKDRTYPGLSWDMVLFILDYDSTKATYVNISMAGEQGPWTASWEIADLLGRTDGGLALDPRGNVVAVFEELGQSVLNVARIVID